MGLYFYFKTSILSFVIILISVPSIGFADYASRVKEINDFIQKNIQTIKSTEEFDVPQYKGDALSFQRFSKMVNIFSLDHHLPFEKITTEKSKSRMIELKSITVSQELQKIMSVKKTKLQSYPIDAFIFKGFISQNGNHWGIVECAKEASKTLYLKKGTLVGPNYGQIKNITKDGILIDQWQKSTQNGSWKKIQAIID